MSSTDRGPALNTLLQYQPFVRLLRKGLAPRAVREEMLRAGLDSRVRVRACDSTDCRFSRRQLRCSRSHALMRVAGVRANKHPFLAAWHAAPKQATMRI